VIGHPDIRLLLADVDGTLVTQDKVLTEAAKAAARELHERVSFGFKGERRFAVNLDRKYRERKPVAHFPFALTSSANKARRMSSSSLVYVRR